MRTSNLVSIFQRYNEIIPFWLSNHNKCLSLRSIVSRATLVVPFLVNTATLSLQRAPFPNSFTTLVYHADHDLSDGDWEFAFLLPTYNCLCSIYLSAPVSLLRQVNSTGRDQTSKTNLKYQKQWIRIDCAVRGNSPMCFWHCTNAAYISNGKTTLLSSLLRFWPASPVLEVFTYCDRGADIT